MQQALTHALLMDAVVGALQTPEAIYAASKLSYFDKMLSESKAGPRGAGRPSPGGFVPLSPFLVSERQGGEGHHEEREPLAGCLLRPPVLSPDHQDSNPDLLAPRVTLRP